jgi:nucleoside-diphosphate-sugar epimerase
MTPILVTGASGFVGRHFINTVKKSHIVYAIARRSQHDAGIPLHSNIHWYRCDITKKEKLALIIDDIAQQGGVVFIFHFAGYYDFTNSNSPEYQRTNVDGTRYLLEYAEKLKVQRFIFSSSLTVTDYSDPNLVLNEQSPLDATIPYALSKKAAEDLIASYSEKFPCTIVRLAAIFSDWCEYGPLYILLRNWLSDSWKATLIPGRGETALPYLHVHDLNSLFRRIMSEHKKLSNHDMVVASPDGCVSHKNLFTIAVRYFYVKHLELRSIPVWLAKVGVFCMEVMGRLTGNPPFERVWMLDYIDRRMTVDSSATRRLLSWEPTARYHITRRMLFLIENMKSNPNLWLERNLAMAHKKTEERPGLKIYEVMVEVKEQVIVEHVDHLIDPTNRESYPHYNSLDRETLRLRATLIYEMLEVVFLNGDRQHILCYAHYLARQRSMEGIDLIELTQALQHTAEHLKNVLLNHPVLTPYRQRIHDEIGLTIQLIMDEIEDVYEHIDERAKDRPQGTVREECLTEKIYCAAHVR